MEQQKREMTPQRFNSRKLTLSSRLRTKDGDNVVGEARFGEFPILHVVIQLSPVSHGGGQQRLRKSAGNQKRLA